jgi:hypothetical protein
MVHALERVHSLIAPGGVLIDIHPQSYNPPVRVNGQHVGVVRETDDFVEYRQASAAVEEVIGRGLFAVERSATFPVLTHADSLPELLSFLAEEWTAAVLEDGLQRRIESLMPGEIVIEDTVGMARLHRIP